MNTTATKERRDSTIRPPAGGRFLAAAVLAATIALAGCGGGGGSVGAGGTTDPRAVSFQPARTLEPLPDGAMSNAVGINAGGTVVGLSGTASREVRAVRWRVSTDNDAVSAPTELRPLPGNGYSAAYAVNDNGVVAGESGENADNVIVAVLWPAGATAASRLPALGAGNSAAYCINTAGRIVGEAVGAGGQTLPAYWSSPSATPVALALLPGGATGSAYFISDQGVIVGESETGNGSLHAVRWKVDPATGIAGAPTDLGTLSGHVRSVAMGVNRDGVIVGESESPSGEVHTVTWKDGSLAGVPTGIDISDHGAAGVGSSGTAINDDGWIVGWANDNAAAPRNALWNALGSPPSNVNADFAGQGRATGINRYRYVVGTRSDKGFVAAPR